MRRITGTTGVLLMVASFGLVPLNAVAATRPPLEKNQILVTGVVPQHRLIIVDTGGKITQIFSNTASDVAPTVTSNSLAGEPVAFEGAIKQQYNRIWAGVGADKVVTITAVPSDFPLAYLNFRTANASQFYLARPAKHTGLPAPPGYYIAIN